MKAIPFPELWADKRRLKATVLVCFAVVAWSMLKHETDRNSRRI